MTQIVVDPAIQFQLAGVKHILELCDNSGRVLGHFLPVISSSEKSDREPQISAEEIQQRLQGGGRPLADILADLGKMS